MSVASFISAFCCDHLSLLILWCTLMLIGLVVQLRASPPQAMLCFSATTSSPGPPSVRTLSPDPAPWPTVLLRLRGCVSCCTRSTPLFAEQRWCIVTTSAPSTCPPIWFNISEPSISRLIYTSSGSGSPLVIFVSFFTKGLPSSVFTEFRTNLNVRGG